MKTDVEQDQLLVGIGSSPGIAIGRALVVHLRPADGQEREIAPEEAESEVAALHGAIDAARRQLEEVRKQVADQPILEHLHIIDTHLLLLEDQMLIGETIATIQRERIDAAGALRRTLHGVRQVFANIDDEYLRERGSDVDFVGQRILRNLGGHGHPSLRALDGQVILVAHDLSPADTLQLDRKKILGFLTDAGGRTAHTSILARSLGIPAVVGLENATRLIGQDVPVIMDGCSGVVVINPTPESFCEYLQRKQQYEVEERELGTIRALPAETVDGCRLELRANLEQIEEIPQAQAKGAVGVGLMRTEFFYMNRSQPPDEEEQFRLYRTMVQRMAPHPVTIRTLDVGGDKLVPEINLAGEANPAMGLRAIRFSLKEGGLFRTQLRAILRASVYGPVRILFPMVSGIAEVRACRDHLQAAMDELRGSGVKFDAGIQVGAIVETPSAALIADFLVREVDFLSVGTNDLIQYCLAVDRGNEHVAYLYDPLHPAVLRALRMICMAGRAAGIPVGMCGEMAAEPIYLPLLVGLGFSELSMNPTDIPRIKRVLRQLRCNECATLLEELLQLATGEEVGQALEAAMQTKFPDFFGNRRI